MTRKFKKTCAIFAMCIAATCPATTCSFDATLPSMDVQYGFLTPMFPLWGVNFDIGDPADVGQEATDGN